MPHVGDILVGRYRIDAPLGSGGSAMVYRAHDLRLQRDVALKILLPNLAQDQAVAHRFEREARSLAAVNHPGIVAVYDVEPADRRTDREPFFVMELCERGSLADLLATRGGRLSPDEIVPAIVDVAGGLASLHGRGFVHRDVKPHNILLTGGGAKLGDFGIARGEDSQGGLTGTGTAMGTLAFLAPEVLAGGPATPAADVFALGVVVYQALTSRLPRPAGTVMEFVQAQAEPVEAASAVVPGLGPFFDAPVAAALAGDPAARPSPIQLAGALKAALADWRRAGRRPDPIAVPSPVAGAGEEPPSAASGRTSGSRPVRLAPPDVAAAAAAARTAAVRTRPARRPPNPTWLPQRRRSWAGPAIAVTMLAALAALVAFALLGGFGGFGRDPGGPTTQPSPPASDPASPSVPPSASPSASPSGSESPSASPSPTSTPTPTPTGAASPSPALTPTTTPAVTPPPTSVPTLRPIVDPAQARTYLDNVRTAIRNAAAVGRVSTADADALLIRAAGIASDVDARLYDDAANGAAELRRAVDELEQAGRFVDPAEIRRAIENLLSVLPRPTA